VLGDSGGHDDIKHYQYPPRYYDEFHTALHDYEQHHHHGPGDYDILPHDHDGPDDHYHNIDNIDNDDSADDYYGSADHDHDRPAVNLNIRIDNNDPYGHDDNDNIIDTPGYRS
jgi:hypothetical protein